MIGKNQCPDCGHKNSPGDTFCRKCSGNIYSSQVKEKSLNAFVNYFI
jgi:ribosomal protein L40E